MIAFSEIGHLALFIALICTCFQTCLPVMRSISGKSDLLAISKTLQSAATALVLLSFTALLYGFITSDFSLSLVATHSHSAKPLIYKISGTWGNHEGSLLLWIVILVVFGGIFAWTSNALPARFVLLTLSVQGAVTASFLAFSLFTSSPFERLAIPPLDGRGLNPVLQDIGLALHPPMLYLGYVGLSLAFSMAVAGLIQGRIDKDWGRWLRPWALSAWSALTLGIALGSWWAYYELGWGGWWFWDPVENASLMPWLAATALMHSALVVEKRGMLKSWTVLLAILGFSLSLLGTFIVRSGLLTSVHSFASDPSRGVFILMILLIAVGIPLILFAWRGPQLSSPSDSALISRDTALIVNNIILVMATAVVLLGTFYPLGLELVSGARITVGPPYFDATFNPIMAIGLFGMAVAPMLMWRQGWLRHARAGLLFAAATALVLGAIMSFVFEIFSAAAWAGVALLIWLGMGILSDMQSRIKFHQPAQIISRIRQLGMPVWGIWLGHFGMAVFLLGALGDGIGKTEVTVRAQPGDVIEVGQKRYRFIEMQQNKGPNYITETALLAVETGSGEQLGYLTPEKRFYPAERQTTTEAAIRPRLSGDDYAVLGDGDDIKGYSLRLYHKPFVSWIWGGAVIMAFGGILAFIGRRPLNTQHADLSRSL